MLNGIVAAWAAGDAHAFAAFHTQDATVVLPGESDLPTERRRRDTWVLSPTTTAPRWA